LPSGSKWIFEFGYPIRAISEEGALNYPHIHREYMNVLKNGNFFPLDKGLAQERGALYTETPRKQTTSSPPAIF
jgi:hypothetical protein